MAIFDLHSKVSAVLAPVDYQEGDFVPFHLNPSIVIASFFVSLTGAITTVELLQRRTHVRGWLSWFELLSCSVSFGLVAIWCMHYVGNRAIILGNGDPDLQLNYNPTLTALSSIIPIIALFIAFTIADRRHRGPKQLFASLVASGVTAGQAIVGMHYTGTMGISNYHVVFEPKYILGAVLIASTACVTALTLIFMLQDRWISILPYRLMAAVVLAGAVSSMHFEASMGTRYQLRYRSEHDAKARDTNVIVATVFSFLTLPICFAVAWSTSKRQKQLADRAQQVILACARFDPDGKLMVTGEGLLPCQSITVHENDRCFDDEFNVAHPAFQWIFRVSHEWACVMRWIPRMRQHLKAIHFIADAGKKPTDTDTTSLLDWDVTSEVEDYSLLLRQSFCVAAADLANDFNEPLCDVGTLYDGVMMTGTLAAGGPHRRRSVSGSWNGTPKSLIKDLEANVGVDVFGKGQLLFLVKQCDAKETNRLLAEGFRFVSPDKVESHMARSMQVPPSYLSSQVKCLRDFARAESEIDVPTGTLLGFFALRASILKRSWDVLVRRDYRYRIPCVQLSPILLDSAISSHLAQFDGMSVANLLARLNIKLANENDPQKEFWKLLKNKINSLQDQIGEPFFRNAIFSAQLAQISTWNAKRNRPSLANLFVFHVVPDVHESSLKSSPHLTYTPKSFLKCRQMTLEGVTRRISFERKIDREFASLFSRREPGNVSPSKTRRQSSFDKGKTKMPFSSVVPINWYSIAQSVKHTSTVASLLSLASRIHPGCDSSVVTQPDLPLDGIVVTSDVVIETGPSAADDGMVEFTVEPPGKSACARYADSENTTYVDELYQITVARWQRS